MVNIYAVFLMVSRSFFFRKRTYPYLQSPITPRGPSHNVLTHTAVLIGVLGNPIHVRTGVVQVAVFIARVMLDFWGEERAGKRS